MVRGMWTTLLVIIVMGLCLAFPPLLWILGALAVGNWLRKSIY